MRPALRGVIAKHKAGERKIRSPAFFSPQYQNYPAFAMTFFAEAAQQADPPFAQQALPLPQQLILRAAFAPFACLLFTAATRTVLAEASALGAIFVQQEVFTTQQAALGAQQEVPAA